MSGSVDAAGSSASAFHGRRQVAVIAAHPVLDAYAGFVPPILGILQVRCELTAFQAASLLSMGAVISGLCQPLFAWLTDRIDSRAFGTIGLAVAAASLSSIGLAHDFQSLVLLYAAGMLGVGAFHPVAAASVGRLAGRRRSVGITLFFVAGMAGAAAGPVLSSRITALEPHGFDLLRWLMIPGLVAAVLLHLAVRNVTHRHPAHRTLSFSAAESRRRWRTTVGLFVGNAMRYTVYMALLYLYVRWAHAVMAGRVAEDVAGLETSRLKAAAIYCGELNAATMIGMGIGGLLAGTLVRAGREKWPLVLIPLLLAPAVALIPSTGYAGSLALAAAAGVGFAAIIPVTISIAQRLLPHRTSLASSIMMGGAWAVSAVGPPAAEWAHSSLGLDRAFALAALLLAASGLVGIPLDGGLIKRVGDGDGA